MKRVLSIALIIVGVIFGSNNMKTGICFGDKMFTMLGLSPWSNGATGTHYPAIIGLVCILVGIGILGTTLRTHSIWQIITLAIVVLGIVYSLFGLLKSKEIQKEDIVILNPVDVGEEKLQENN